MTLPIYSIIFAVVYLAMLVSYFFSETSGNFKRRAWNKIIMATTFWGYALFEMFHLGLWGSNIPYTILMIGITFSYIGDVWLLWSFTKGGIAFGVGNAIIVAGIIELVKSMGVPFANYWFFILVCAFFLCVFLILWKKGFYKDLKAPMIYMFTPYIGSVTAHGTLSLVLIFVLGLAGLMTPQLWFLFAGSILFMISDYFISWHNFRDKKSKLILRCNSGSYFFGLMLVVLSFTLGA